MMTPFALLSVRQPFALVDSGCAVRKRAADAGNQFNLPPRVVIPIATLMFVMKLSSKHASRDVRRGGHIELVALPAIAQVEAAFIFRPAVPPFRAEFLPRRRFQLAELFLQLLPARLRSNSLKRQSTVRE